jgi:toxin ParE1/3/4
MQPPLAQPLIDLLIEHEVADASERVAGIVVAVDVLTRNPMIGRPVQAPFREFVIGRGPRGYVAPYRYAADDDAVHVVGVRGQREAGFSSV